MLVARSLRKVMDHEWLFWDNQDFMNQLDWVSRNRYMSARLAMIVDLAKANARMR